MTCTETVTPRVTHSADTHSTLRHSFDGMIQTLMVWQRRRDDRKRLRDMPDYLLRDVGLDAATARNEADKPFWRS